MNNLQPTSQPSSKWVWCFWIVLAILWFTPLGYRALIHADEGRYATLSLEMLQTGDWITPRLNGLLYFEKPILQYWMGAISFALFGINEFAARLWPGLTGFLTIAMVSFTAKKLWGQPAGYYAALSTGSMAWIVANSHFLTLDMGVTFFLTVALCGFLLAHQDAASRSQSRNWMLLTWAAMAGATLSKGLIGILIPGASLVFYVITQWQWRSVKKMNWINGLIVFFVLASPWFILVSIKHASFIDFFFIHEHFDRFLKPDHNRNGPLWYFVPYLILGLLPWTTLLPQLAKEAWKKETNTLFQTKRLLLIWSCFIFVFFSLSDSKLPSYILPIFPALGLLLGSSLTQLPTRTLAKHFVFPFALWLALLLISPFTMSLLPSGTDPNIVHALALGAAGAAVLVVIFTVLAWHALRQQRRTRALTLYAFGHFIAILILLCSHNNYGIQKSSQLLVKRIQPYLNASTPIYSVRYYEQTFPFYLQRQVTLVDYVDEFAFGEKQEPQRWIPDISTFYAQWRHDKHAIAMTGWDTYNLMKQQHLPMKIIYQDNRRLVIAKP